MRAQVRTDRAMYLYIAFSLLYWVCYLAVKQIESNELKNELTIGTLITKCEESADSEFVF